MPAHKIVERWERLWPLVAEAIPRANRADAWDNTRRDPPDKVADFIGGLAVRPPRWPRWLPAVMRDLS